MRCILYLRSKKKKICHFFFFFQFFFKKMELRTLLLFCLLFQFSKSLISFLFLSFSFHQFMHHFFLSPFSLFSMEFFLLFLKFKLLKTFWIGALHPDQQTILVDWYNSLTNHGSLDWDTERDLCQESGVTCDESSPYQRVLHL